MAEYSHIFFTKADKGNAPEIVFDDNGEVALQLCKACGEAGPSLQESPTCSVVEYARKHLLMPKPLTWAWFKRLAVQCRFRIAVVLVNLAVRAAPISHPASIALIRGLKDTVINTYDAFEEMERLKSIVAESDKARKGGKP